MTKQEFVDAVADKAGMSKRDASTAVDACLGVIESTLQAGDAITFTGFGKFHVTRAPPGRASTPAPVRRCRSRLRTSRSSRPGRSSRRQ